MQLHNITKSKGTKRKQRVGRGSTRGKTSGRGHKGQKARAGHSIRPAERDIIKRLPKRRGHGINRSRTVNTGRVRPTPVNVGDIDTAFSDGDTVSPKTLVDKKVVSLKSGRLPKVKVLGFGKLTKKITLEQCETSGSAKATIEKAGGKVL
jgi:large subunit ribosomal protein L15